MAFKIKKIKIMIKINKIQFQSPPLHLCRLAENKIYLHTTSILKTSKSKIPVPAPRKENKSPVNTGIGSVSQGSMLVELYKDLLLVFTFLFIIILCVCGILKFFGISIWVFLNSHYYIKIYFFLTISLAILYFLIQLYTIHKFLTKNIKISEVLPKFIYNWLKDIQMLTRSKLGRKDRIENTYLNLGIYLVLMVLLILVY